MQKYSFFPIYARKKSKKLCPIKVNTNCVQFFHKSAANKVKQMMQNNNSFSNLTKRVE